MTRARKRPAKRFKQRGWHARWHRPRDASMTVRIAGTLIVVLLIVAGVAIWYVAGVTGRATGEEFKRRLGNQLEAIVTLMDETPAAERPKLIAAISSPLFTVALQDTARGFVPARGEARRILTDMTDQGILAPLKTRTLRVHVPEWDETKNRMADTKLAVRLEDGAWLVFAIPSYVTNTIWTSTGILTGLGWVIAFIILILVVAKRMSRPLRRFTEATERLGRDLNAPPMAETGGPELKRAARTFNDMQQRLQRYLDDRTLMLAAISHDLRSYLTRLRLRIEFLEGEERDKAARDVEDMERILNDTLDFARDDAAREEVVQTDLSAFAAERIARFAEAGKAARFDGGPALTAPVRPVALARALDNLIENAIRHGGEAAISVAGEDGLGIITIRDKGAGIPEAEWEKVFRPFYRADQARTLGAGGTGLGLAIARSTVRGHGGDVRFMRDGQGFGVRLELPL